MNLNFIFTEFLYNYLPRPLTVANVWRKLNLKWTMKFQFLYFGGKNCIIIIIIIITIMNLKTLDLKLLDFIDGFVVK